MTSRIRTSVLITSIALAALSICKPVIALAQQSTTADASAQSAVLVELFTSEGCSSCPPADELLREISGHATAEGQLIVGISEHVSYWNGFGWKDPFSSDVYTNRQNEYGERFGLKSIYTPQMIVNGREQFVGGDRRSLAAALAGERARKEIKLHITSAEITANRVAFSYSATDLPVNRRLQFFAVLVDDTDQSNVLRGENSGRELVHVSVARAFAPLGTLHQTGEQSMSLPSPPSFTTNSRGGHHLVLFAQEPGAGAVLGVDTRPI